jgi:hypothetical protein
LFMHNAVVYLIQKRVIRKPGTHALAARSKTDWFAQCLLR